MDEATEKKALLVSMHDLWYLSAAWMRAVTAPQLVGCLASLLGPDVELHHSTMHVKPPETGHPFPMHQDNAFYEHHDERFVAVLIHLDDTDASNGEIRFMDGSHKMGALEHVRRPQAGEPCTPHLPTDPLVKNGSSRALSTYSAWPIVINVTLRCNATPGRKTGAIHALDAISPRRVGP